MLSARSKQTPSGSGSKTAAPKTAAKPRNREILRLFFFGWECFRFVCGVNCFCHKQLFAVVALRQAAGETGSRLSPRWGSQPAPGPRMRTLQKSS